MFRSPVPVVVWYGWLIFAALNMIDLAVQGRDHTAITLAAVLVLVTGVMYVTAFRPRIIAEDDAVTVRNPLCDIRVPWGSVASVDLGDMVRVHCRAEPGAGATGRERVVYGWALHSSRRSRLKAELRARRAAKRAAQPAPAPGFARLPEEAQALATLSPAALAAAQLDEWRGKAHQRGAPGGQPVVTWSAMSVAALLVPAALVAAAAVIP